MATDRPSLKTLKEWYEIIKEDVPHPFRKPLMYLFISILLSFLASKLPVLISYSAFFFIWFIFVGLIVLESRNLISAYKKSNDRKKRSRELTDHVNIELNTHHKNEGEIGKYFGFDQVKVILAPEEKKQAIKFFLDKIKTNTNIEVFKVPLEDKENESVNRFYSWMRIVMHQYLIGIHDYLTPRLSIMLKINKFQKFLDADNSVQQNLFSDLQKGFMPKSNITTADMIRLETLDKEGLLKHFFIDTIYWIKNKNHSPHETKSEVEYVFNWLTTYKQYPDWDLRLTTASNTKIFPNSKFSYMIYSWSITDHGTKAHEHFNSGGNIIIPSIFTDNSLNEQYLSSLITSLNNYGHSVVKYTQGIKYDRRNILRNVKYTILKHRDFDYSLD